MSNEFTLHLGDCLAGLAGVEAESVDAMVTDPPAGIGFMGREWDSNKGGRVSWIAWMESVMREALRVLKPGAHGLVWALPRTSHWTATALEQAGFEVRDVIVHAFGTGFPKSLNVSKAIDEAAGATREIVGAGAAACEYLKKGEPCVGHGDADQSQENPTRHMPATAPATEAAKQWAGFGTALKPATEHWILVRKKMENAECVDPAKSAEPSTPRTRRGSNKDADERARRAAESSFEVIRRVLRTEDGKEVVAYVPTDTSPSTLDPIKNALNTISSSSGESDDRSGMTSKSTTETESDTTTDRKISNSPQSRITPSSTRKSEDWNEGYPATEHYILVRKPLDGTVAANVQEHGTGALNIDACRIAGAPEAPGTTPATQMGIAAGQVYGTRTRADYVVPEGRWPANLVLSHTEWCEPIGAAKVKSAGSIGKDTAAAGPRVNEVLGKDARPRGEWSACGNGDGTETITAWRCLPGCPVALLDAQSGTLKSGSGQKSNRTAGAWAGGALKPQTQEHEGSKGGASRFFYVSKPTTEEREENVRDLPKRSAGELVDREAGSAGMSNPRAGAGRTSRGRANIHPTVKSVALMSWLITLVTPPGGLVLDPFTGSGTTGVTALRLGHRFLGFEVDPGYHRIALAKLERARRGEQLEICA